MQVITTHRRHALHLRVALHHVEVEHGVVGVRLGGEAQHLDPVLAAVVEQQAHRGDDAVQPGLGQQVHILPRRNKSKIRELNSIDT